MVPFSFLLHFPLRIPSVSHLVLWDRIEADFSTLQTVFKYGAFPATCKLGLCGNVVLLHIFYDVTFRIFFVSSTAVSSVAFIEYQKQSNCLQRGCDVSYIY